MTAAGGRNHVFVERVAPFGDDDKARGVRRVAVDAEWTRQNFIGGLMLDDNPVPGPAVDLQRRDRDHLGLQPAVQPFDALNINACEPGSDRPAGKIVRVADIRSLVPNAGPVDVTECRVEVPLDFLARQPPAQAGSIRRPQSQAEGAVVPAQPLRVGLKEPCVGLQDSAVAQPAVEIAKIHARNGIAEVGIGVALGDDETQGGLFENAQGGTARKDIAAADVAESGLPHGQSADAPGTESPAKLAAIIQVHGLARGAEPQAPGKERPAVLQAGPRCGTIRIGSSPADAAEFEDVGVLEKERPLLREEQVESRQVHLPGVDLGGGEVGIQCQRGIQRGSDLVEQIQRGPRSGRIARDAARILARDCARNFVRVFVGAVEVPAPIQGNRGHDIQPEPLFQAGKAGGDADDARIVGAITGNPGDFLPLSAHRTGEVDSPRVVVRIEGNRLQGNRDLRGPAFGVGCGCHVPDRVPDRKVLADVLVDRFMLDAVGVGFELVAAAPVVEGRENDRDAVVVAESKRSVAQGTGGDPPGLAVPEAPADVQRFVVVEQVDFGTFARLGALDGARLVEIVNDGRPRPHGIVEAPVDHRRRVRSHHAHGLQGFGVWPRLLRRDWTGQAAQRGDDRGRHLVPERHFDSGLRCGKRMTSRMEGESVSSMISRSMPRPSPAAGGIPYSRARM